MFKRDWSMCSNLHLDIEQDIHVGSKNLRKLALGTIMCIC